MLSVVCVRITHKLKRSIGLDMEEAEHTVEDSHYFGIFSHLPKLPPLIIINGMDVNLTGVTHRIAYRLVGISP